MSISGSVKTIVIATATGALLAWATLNVIDDDAIQKEKIVTLENRIKGLESMLAQKDEALAKARSRSWNSLAQLEPGTRTPATKTQPSATVQLSADIPEKASSESAPIDSQQVLRDLSTTSERDPRSFSAKVNDMLAMDSSLETVAIVSQGMVDKASSPDILPNHDLEALYQSQSNPEVKRVTAQVLSMRGDNTLMDRQVSSAQAALRSENAAERQQALIELGKTRYAGAANSIVPLLQDANTEVKMNALLALKATGNQTHIHLIESLAHSSDPSVSWLANDVINSLQNLSEKARTRVNSADAVAELPILAGQ